MVSYSNRNTSSDNTLYASNTPDFAGYKDINKLIKDIELPRTWQKDLKQYCDDKGIEFMSTPFDEQAVDELVSLGVKRLKIAGFEATDPRFVEVVASTGLPIIMSAGIGFDFKYWGKFYDIFKTTQFSLQFILNLLCQDQLKFKIELFKLDIFLSISYLFHRRYSF